MSSMIASALAIYSNLNTKDRQGFVSQPSPPSLPTGSKPTINLSEIERTKKDTQ